MKILWATETFCTSFDNNFASRNDHRMVLYPKDKEEPFEKK